MYEREILESFREENYFLPFEKKKISISISKRNLIKLNEKAKMENKTLSGLINEKLSR